MSLLSNSDNEKKYVSRAERKALMEYHERLTKMGALTPLQRDILDANLEEENDDTD